MAVKLAAFHRLFGHCDRILPSSGQLMVGGGAAMFLGLWPGYRQSGWRLLLGGFLVMSWMDHFVFHALLPSFLV
jgi:hypothetical protein